VREHGATLQRAPPAVTAAATAITSRSGARRSSARAAAATANCAEPAKVVADMISGASGPIPAERATNAERDPERDHGERRRQDGSRTRPEPG
jgi:hypothetical protein